MKKNYLVIVLLLLTLLGSYGCPLSAMAQLAIFNSSPSARPGEAISLQGSFSKTASVYLQSSSSASPQLLAPLTQGAGQVTVQVPSTLPLERYQLWVAEGGKTSSRVTVNQARGMHFDTPEVAPGSEFRIFGRNLQLAGGTTQVRIGGYAAAVNVGASNAYSLTVNAPSTLPVGTYPVIINNGGGDVQVEQSLTAIAAYKGDDTLHIGLPPWANKFTSAITNNVYNVITDSRLDSLAKGNGEHDDTNAIQGAIDKAAVNGGVVYLPKGTYLIGRRKIGYLLTMKSKVILRGAGPGLTFIKLDGNEPIIAGSKPVRTKQSWAFLFEDKANLTGILDLTYTNKADTTYKYPKRNMLLGRGTSEVFIKNCTFNLGESTWLELTSSNKIAFINNTVNQGANLRAGHHGPVRMDTCRNYYVARNVITYGVDGFNLNRATNGVWEKNTIRRDGNAVYSQDFVHNVYVVNHVLIVNFTKNFACLDNKFEVINKAALLGKEINDGETIIAEGGPNSQAFESVGKVINAFTATVQVDKSWLNSDSSKYGQPVVAIVRGKGMGQWQAVTSRASNTLNLGQNWAVVPDTSSRYATFVWGARNWLVQGNSMSNNQRGITLYHNATTDVAIVGNTLTNNGSIDLTPLQRQDNLRTKVIGFNPVFNTQIVANKVDCSRDTTAGAFIGVHTVQHVFASTFGTSAIGVEMRGNKLTAAVPNLPAKVDNVFPNGYLNYLEYHQDNGIKYADRGVPAVLGTILQNNEAVNCQQAVHLNSGSYSTLVCNTTLTGTGTLLDDQVLEGVSHASVGTSTACQSMPVTTLRAPENPTSTTAGLAYGYYEGSWTSLPNFQTLTPVATGSAANFNLAVAPRDYNYALQFTGYVRVPADGQYTFSTNSDDGSRLYIGSTLVVDNDGLHGTQEKSGQIGLRAGVHALTVAYLQGGGGQNLSVSYQSPALAKQLIPATALVRPSAVVRRINAGGGVVTNTIGTFAADVNYSGGATYATTASIAGTTNGTMYQSERNGYAFGYALPVANGTYTVVLHFAELYWTQAGQRVFNVSLEGTPWLTSYDIVKKVGPLKATTETVTVTVTDGSLNIAFTTNVDQAKVAAIEVLSGSSTARQSGPALTASALADQLRAYPNPSQGAFMVTCTVPTAQAATLLLVDALGQVAQRQVMQLRTGANELTFPTAPSLATGLYQLQLIGEDGRRQTQKILITH